MASIVVPIGYSGSSCGYCGEHGQRSAGKNSYSYGFWAVQLSCQDYKNLIDTGWRRSGAYVYNPDRARTCCPQYTIKLDAAQFKPSRSLRQELHRFNRWVTTDRHPSFSEEGAKETANHGTASAIDVDMPSAPSIAAPAVDVAKVEGVAAKHEESDDLPTDSHAQTTPHTQVTHKRKGKNNTFDLVECVKEAQKATDAAHNLHVSLEKASYTDEKFELFSKYQVGIHHETPSEQRQSSFKGFLVDGPLKYAPIQYTHGRQPSLPSHYGQYHHMYRVDGRLIAMGVVDILPQCVSSVYLMYDPLYQPLNLGKISALYEIALATEMRAAGAGPVDVYMGYYIHDCVKMKYKAAYQPSYLLDAQTHTFYSYKEAAETLDKHRWASFARGENIKLDGGIKRGDEGGGDGDGSDEDEDDENLPSPPPAGFLDPHTLPKHLLNDIKILDNKSMALLTYFTLPRSYRPQINDIVAALGEKARDFILLIT